MATSRLSVGPKDGADGKNLVIESIETPARDRCVDIFRRPDGSFGFEEWRRDPEDPSGWHRVGLYGGHVFSDAEEATKQARVSVAWLAVD